MKGFVFSLDAVIVLGLVLTLAFFLAALSFTYSSPELRYQRLYYTGKDLLNLMEQTKLSSIQDNPVVQDYLNKSILIEDDLNKSIMDVIGSMWAGGNKSYAGNITNEFFNLILPENYGYEVLMDTDSIYKKESGTNNFVSRQNTIVSGYSLGKPVSGYVASAFLARMSKITSSYVYFGGYEGDGNLTKLLELPSDANVKNAYLEVNAGNNFTLYINGNSAGDFQANGTNMTANIKQNITANLFQPGNNTITLNFTTNQSRYIGGGYLKVTYQTSQPNTLPIEVSNYIAKETFWLPGIKGLINLYSSFYVSGSLNSMEAFLHYYTPQNYTIFVNIGNVTVFEKNETGEHKITLSNENLSANISYDAISNKTVPLRVGFKNITYEEMFGAGNADVVLITDVSGSMNWMLEEDDQPGTVRNCNNPDLYSADTRRISLAKCLDKQFVDIILNNTGNRVGLVAYNGLPSTIPTYPSQIILSTYPLSSDNVSLKNQIDSYVANGATGVCGAIREATIMLEEQSDASRLKFIIVMTDGLSNVQCDLTDENETEGCIPNECPSEVFCSGGGCVYKVAERFASSTKSSVAFFNNGWIMISGRSTGDFKAYQWNITWSTNSSLTNGLVDIGSYSSPEFVFNITGDGKWDIIAGRRDGDFVGYYWDGVQWVSNSSLVVGLGDIGGDSSPTIAYNVTGNGKWSLIAGMDSGAFTGFYWNGTQWVSNSSLIGGLWDIGSYSSPEFVFNITGDGKWDMIAGTSSGAFTGFYWNGTQWVSNSSLITGLPTDVSSSSPSIVFNMMPNKWYLITGDSNGRYFSFYWNGEKWISICYDFVSIRATNDGINASCRANERVNATIHSIGLGPISYCPLAQYMLTSIAECGNGNYYASSNATELLDIYTQVAQNIVSLSYQAQTISIEGATANTVLYPDSHIEFNYTALQALGYGEVNIVFESERFGGNVTSPKKGTFFIPDDDTKILDAKVTSYSSKYWTDRLMVNSSKTPNWQMVYNLNEYGNDYLMLGDPYIVNVPVNLLEVGENNSVSIDTALSPYNTTGGSPDSRVIYSLGVEGIIGYGDVFPTEQNATDNAVQRLNQKLQKYNVTSTEIETVSKFVSNVPSLWGPAILEIRVFI